MKFDGQKMSFNEFYEKVFNLASYELGTFNFYYYGALVNNTASLEAACNYALLREYLSSKNISYELLYPLHFAQKIGVFTNILKELKCGNQQLEVFEAIEVYFLPVPNIDVMLIVGDVILIINFKIKLKPYDFSNIDKNNLELLYYKNIIESLSGRKVISYCFPLFLLDGTFACYGVPSPIKKQIKEENQKISKDIKICFDMESEKFSELLLSILCKKNEEYKLLQEY